MDANTRAKINQLFNRNNICADNIEDICKSFCEEVTQKYNNQQKRVEAINEELTKLRQENWKDETLQDMKNSLEVAQADNRRGFPISEEEYKAIQKWKNNHYITQHNAETNFQRLKMGGAIGGNFDYEFIPTSIGTFGNCLCGFCRNKAFQEAKGNRAEYSRLLKKYDAIFDFQQAI